MGQINLSHLNIGALTGAGLPEQAAVGARTDNAVSSLPQIKALITNALTKGELNPAQEKEFYSQLQARVKDLTGAGVHQMESSQLAEMLHDVAEIAKATVQQPAQEKTDVQKVHEFNHTPISSRRSLRELEQKIKEINPTGVKSASQIRERGEALEKFLRGTKPEELRLLKDVPQFKSLLSATGGNPEIFAKVLTAGQFEVLAEDKSLHADLASVIGKLTPDDQAIREGSEARGAVLQELKGKLMALAKHASPAIDRAIATMAGKLDHNDKKEIIDTVNASVKKHKAETPQAQTTKPSSAPSSPTVPKWKQKQQEEQEKMKQEAEAQLQATLAKAGARGSVREESSSAQISAADVFKDLATADPKSESFRASLTDLMVNSKENNTKNSKEFMAKLDTPVHLAKFWQQESATINQKSDIDNRKARMQQFLPQLTEQQLKDSAAIPRFMALLGDTVNGYADTAALALSANQLGSIASCCNGKDQLVHLANLMAKLGTDSEQKADTRQKLEAIWHNLSDSGRIDPNVLKIFQQKIAVVFSKDERGALMQATSARA